MSDNNKDEMMASMAGMPSPIRIEVFYDAKLQEITGVKSEPVIMSQGATFIYLLQNIFMAHPEIEKEYPPGALGMVVNGYPPKMYSPLFDEDKIMITVG